MVRRSIIGLSVKLLVIFFTLTKGRKFWITMDGFLGPVLDRDFLEFRLDWMVLWPHGLYFPFLHHVPNLFFYYSYWFDSPSHYDLYFSRACGKI